MYSSITATMNYHQKILGWVKIMVPVSVGRFLYKGISSQIEFLMKHNNSLGENYSKQLFDDITESLEWYKINCTVSYEFLKEAYDELVDVLNSNNH